VPDERATLSAVAKLEHSEGWVMVWGAEKPAFSVGFEQPTWSGDSGFTVLFEDAPDPEDVAEVEPGEHPDVHAMHACCLLEEHPELGPGLEIASEYGVADLADGGEWMVGDLDRL
jgi:hypothetical protein